MDLTTTYLGLRLHSPLVASPGPVTGDPEQWERLEASGAGAIVLPSLFEEQIEHELAAFDRTVAFDDSFGEALDFLPGGSSGADGSPSHWVLGPDHHVALVEAARARLSIPVIASLNGTSPGGWVRYARMLADAGADALELNVYDTVTDPLERPDAVERRLLELVEEVADEIDVPLAVKLGPWYTALGHLARRLTEAGADGLVLFNRLYQPDLDLDTLEVRPRLTLSTPVEARLPLHWIGALRSEVSISLAASTGIHSGSDALKLLLVGADVVMTTSALLLHGPEHLATMRAEMVRWMDERDYDSVAQLRGSVSRANVPDPQVYDRTNYFQTLHSWA
jgi:dihydroorotate dehydrogenase (fumarate)